MRLRSGVAGLTAACALVLTPAAASAQDFEPAPGASTHWWIERPAQTAQNFSSEPFGVTVALSATPWLPFIPFLDPSGHLFETMYGSSDIPVLRDLSPIG